MQDQIIVVKNAEGDPDTMARIVVQNQVEYTPKVSVIIPVYNTEEYLRECLDSVIKQTLKDIEIICVDDGSTDNSLEILKEYAEKDPRFTVLAQQNLFAGAARNAGLAVARGKYVNFLDSDDFVAEDMFRSMYENAEESGSDICICHVNIMNMKQMRTEKCIWGLRDELMDDRKFFSPEDIKDHVFQFNQGWVWDKIYKRSFIEKKELHFQVQRTSNDVYFAFTALVFAQKVAIVDEYLMTHRLHVKGSLENTREKSFNNIVRAIFAIKDFLENSQLYQIYKKSFVNFALNNIKWNYLTLHEPANFLLRSAIQQKYEPLFRSLPKEEFYSEETYTFFEEFFKLPYIKDMQRVIPVVFATNSKYVMPLSVSIKSLIAKSSSDAEYAVLVMHSDISKDDISYLEALSEKNVLIKCVKIDIEKYISRDVAYERAYYSREMYFRVLIPELFWIFDKIIYLDCDIAVNEDVKKLYDVDIEDNIIGAVINPIIKYQYIEENINIPVANYFNSGVLLINCRKFTEYKIKEQFVDNLEKRKDLRYPDQDLLNILCYSHVHYLDTRWNWQWLYKVYKIAIPEYCRSEYQSAGQGPYIIHYSSDKKPWNHSDSYYHLYWWRYLDTKHFNKDTPYTKELEDWYNRAMKAELDLDNPKTFNEKIQWMKLYDSTPIKTRLADKYLVRDWVTEKIGEKYLIPLLGVYDNFDDIDFDKLPNRFVIKCNHGCAYNIIVKDKNTFDKDDARHRVQHWMKENFAFKVGLELHYRDIQPKIIIEQFIENKSADDLYDYKFWCFDGQVKYIQFLSERNTAGLKMAFYDLKWNKQSFVYSYPLDQKEIPRPDNLDEMIHLAEKLSKGFSHVRVDFYRLDDGTIYFGEMTFTSASGAGKWNDEKIHRQLGDWIKLPDKAYDINTGEYYNYDWPHKKLLAVVKNEKQKKIMIYGHSLYSRISSGTKKRITVIGLQVFKREKTDGQVKVHVLGLPIYKKSKSDKHKRIFIFGVQVIKKYKDAEKKRLSVFGIPVYSVRKKNYSVIKRILFLRYKVTHREQNLLDALYQQQISINELRKEIAILRNEVKSVSSKPHRFVVTEIEH